MSVLSSTFAPRWVARPGCLALALAAGLACTGNIGPATGGSGRPGEATGAGDGTSNGSPSSPAAPEPLPPDAPVTGPIASVPGESSRLVRLNHRQWENTTRDLLGLPEAPGLSRAFVNEGVRTRFDNHGGSLEVTAQLWSDYSQAASSLATRVARDPALLGALVPPNAPTDPTARARAFIESFGLRAYRRPLTDADVQQYLGVFARGAEIVGSGDAFVDGAELVIALFLQSPHFLYRVELGGQKRGDVVALTDYEIATRLSYGLAGTMPDAELFEAARRGALQSREELLAQAERLLGSAAGKGTLRDMHDQMIRPVDPTELVRNPELHPGFVPGIGADMKEEALAFIHDVVFERKQGVTELLTAPASFVNGRLAPLYGVPAPAGDGFARVELDAKERAGLYTQLGFLSETATDFHPRPIKRGVFMSEHVLCVDVPPPPPDADMEQSQHGAGKTNRQAFEAVTETPGTICQGCHQAFINPLGFAFENYDGLGTYRTLDEGQSIDAKATFAFAEGERSFDGAVELMGIIAQGRQAHDCYAKHLVEYVYGRSAGGADKALVAELGRRSLRGVPIRDLVLGLVATDAFTTRLP